MSYAIESKKRKFDRILESLSEAASATPSPQSIRGTDVRSTPKGRNTVTSTKFGSLDSIKRRRIASSIRAPGSNASLISSYVPSSRAAFLERLETYRHVTKWHVPSTSSVNAAEWAKRGWVCADVDTVSCSLCGERVVVDLNIDVKKHSQDGDNDAEPQRDVPEPGRVDEDETEELATEVYKALVERYQGMITTSHAETCSWRKRGCDSSIQRVEGLLSTPGAIASARQRTKDISDKIEDIPPVSDLPAYDELPTPDTSSLQEESAHTDAFKLSICGWQYKEADVVECKHCFRSLGLWLYRGVTPTMENLDPVESHLEYCPWRSADAQDTELAMRTVNGTSKTIKLPGWALVYHAFMKQALKTKAGEDSSSKSSEMCRGDQTQVQLTPEQREKKMKDLMRRIKEIKKPFNVKGLLSRKDTVRS